jgi:hypothetical protein
VKQPVTKHGKTPYQNKVIGLTPLAVIDMKYYNTNEMPCYYSSCLELELGRAKVLLSTVQCDVQHTTVPCVTVDSAVGSRISPRSTVGNLGNYPKLVS